MTVAAGLTGCLSTSSSLTSSRAPGRFIAPRLRLTEAVPVPVRSIVCQRQPCAAFGGGIYLLVWQDGFSGAGGASDILGLRLAADGRVLDTSPLRIGSSDGVQESPAVAYGGGRFMVIWSVLRQGSDSDIHGVFVAPDGSLSPAGGFAVAGGPSTQAHPAVASNGKDQFLVVWQAWRQSGFAVCGARISAISGEVLDRDGFVALEAGECPATVWSGAAYGVVSGCRGSVVGEQGSVLAGPVKLWKGRYIGPAAAAAAWGRTFCFFNTTPYPDPWGYEGGGAIVGTAMGPDGGLDGMPRGGLREILEAQADGRLHNALDAARWRNHPGWPAGLAGGLKGVENGLWPSGPPAAAFDGQSLLVVWPRAHWVDHRRLRNRDLYLTRVLPGWGLVDRPPIPVAAGETDESNAVLCGGPPWRTLLAYEKVQAAGVGIEYRFLIEEEDRVPPRVKYVAPLSRTELAVAFDEPISPSSVSNAVFRGDGFAVKSVAFNTDARSLQREAVLTVDPPTPLRHCVLHVSGVRDRSPAANAAEDEAIEFVAKPAVRLRGDFITRWCIIGPLPAARASALVGPGTARPSPGDRVESGGEAWQWKEADGPVVDLRAAYGDRTNVIACAGLYLFSDRPQEAVVHLDSNDHNRLWLNGRLLHDGIAAATAPRGFHDYTDKIPVALREGWNRVLVQVENRAGSWMLVGRLTDPGGQPLGDVTWQLDDPQGLAAGTSR